MIHVKPRAIFERLPRDPDILLRVPRMGEGGLTILETAVLIAAARSINAQSIFEFGTFRGNTALNLARATGAHVWTLDLPEAMEAYPTRGEEECSKLGLSFGAKACADHPYVTQLWGNSRDFSPERYLKSMDMVFIDGGAWERWNTDAENARKMLRSGGLIFWHDYEHIADLTKWLDAHDGMVHIENTRLVVEGWMSAKESSAAA